GHEGVPSIDWRPEMSADLDRIRTFAGHAWAPACAGVTPVVRSQYPTTVIPALAPRLPATWV
ncbi:MAG TPA: hypothetical protein VFI87_05045, partial [Hyphomicrobiaceae bacterium]|nr:hypothetical protein [Hyphomicrobiaceae bacterium]